MYYGVCASMVALLIIEYTVLKKWTKQSIYRFRCCAMVGLIFASFVFLVENIAYVFVSDISEYSLDTCLLIIKNYPMYFADILIVPIICLGILMFASNIVLMRKEGMRPKNLVGTFLGVVLVIATVVLFALSTHLTNLAASFESHSLEVVCTIACNFFFCLLDYVECLMVGIIVMGYVASKQKPSYDKDYIIILGCSISKTGGLLPLIKGRVSSAIKYAWDQEIASGKALKYVPSGGKGNDEIMSEGSAMELFLLSHGAEPYEVFPERESRNTYENFKLSKEIIFAQNPDAKVAFATTNYHMLRSGMLAHKLGMEVEGIASSTKWYFWPNGFAREVIAIFSMTVKKHIFFSAVCLILSILISM